MTRLAPFSSLALLSAVSLLAPASQAGGDPMAGEELADRLCAQCHAIAGPGPSPVANAPPFSGLARKWPIENLAEALAEGIVTSHRDEDQMPEFVFSPEEINDLLIYLESVQR